jgi:DNA-directed RNA polymerase sigma subunit (sigma70/sigma32)
MASAEKMLAPMFQALPWFREEGDRRVIYDDADSSTWFERHLIDTRTPEDEALKQDRLHVLEAILARLTVRERYILQERARGFTLDEIGSRLVSPQTIGPLSRERVRQVEKVALAKAKEIAAQMKR